MAFFVIRILSVRLFFLNLTLQKIQQYIKINVAANHNNNNNKEIALEMYFMEIIVVFFVYFG